MLFRNYADAPTSWLAFELNVMRRLTFRSVVNPMAGEPDIDAHFKRWGVRVATNDVARWAWIKSVARIKNSTERLTEEDIQIFLEDAYVPRYRLRNQALRRWFGESDAWWFDNIRTNAEKLSDPVKQALALTLGIAVGDYALSFADDTQQLRQPLSQVLRRVWQTEPPPDAIPQRQQHTSYNQEAHDFIVDKQADLLFLRLPRARRQQSMRDDSLAAWREEWVRGEDGFWNDFEQARDGRLGGRVETKQQYLRFVEEFLEAAAHIQTWAIVHTESGFVSNEEIVETISRVRKVATTYTKDFSELLGARAAIITTM